MKKGIAITLSLAMVALTLQGCASIPNMTEEQTELVSEYATSLLLKYDKENHSRLVDTSEFMNSYVQAMQIYNASLEKYEAEKELAAEDEESRREEAIEQAAANEAYNNESVNEEESQEIEMPINDGTGGATIISATSIEDYLGANDFSIDFSGVRTMKSYPEGNRGDVFFVIDSTKGNDLVVAYFDVTNNGSSKTKLDIFNKEATFRLGINGKAEKSTFKTMLEDDLSEYLGDFNSGETKQLVLLLEVKEGTQVDNLSLSIALPGKESIKKILK